MKRSNIYRLIQLGLFPAPTHLGGSKWIATEVDEAIERLKDERDRKHGPNKFVPRPSILAALENGALPGVEPASPSSRLQQEVRMLSPELSAALRMLKVDIPELYLDSASWNVSLAVIRVELYPARQTNVTPKSKKR